MSLKSHSKSERVVCQWILGKTYTKLLNKCRPSSYWDTKRFQRDRMDRCYQPKLLGNYAENWAWRSRGGPSVPTDAKEQRRACGPAERERLRVWEEALWSPLTCQKSHGSYFWINETFLIDHHLLHLKQNRFQWNPFKNAFRTSWHFEESTE